MLGKFLLDWHPFELLGWHLSFTHLDIIIRLQVAFIVEPVFNQDVYRIFELAPSLRWRFTSIEDVVVGRIVPLQPQACSFWVVLGEFPTWSELTTTCSVPHTRKCLPDGRKWLTIFVACLIRKLVLSHSLLEEHSVKFLLLLFEEKCLHILLFLALLTISLHYRLCLACPGLNWGMSGPSNCSLFNWCHESITHYVVTLLHCLGLSSFHFFLREDQWILQMDAV